MTVNKEALFNKLNYEPHSEAQWEVHTTDARFKVACCGRRWGKTQAGGHELTAALFTPDTYYWIIGPTYALGEKEFRVVVNDLMKLGIWEKCPTKQYNVNQGNMMIKTPFNSILEVKSADRKTSLVGEGLDGCVMAEAASHDSDTWEMYVEPALSDKRGWALFSSTPRGFNWFQALWEIGQDPRFSDYKSWRLPTWTNSIAYPGGYDDPEMTRIRTRTSKSHWAQEYAAEFTSFEGMIYDEWDDKLHIVDYKYRPEWRNFLVFDFGFADPFVCLDIQVDPSDNVFVWREYQVKGLSTWDHGHIIKNRENPPGYHVDSMFGDPKGADAIATLNLILGSVSARASDVGRGQGYEIIKRWLNPEGPEGRPKLYFDRSCKNTIRQMRQLRFKPTKEGHNAKEDQVDYDDHGPDALRYFFADFFVLGGAGALSDLYGSSYLGSEAEGYFTYKSKVILGS